MRSSLFLVGAAASVLAASASASTVWHQGFEASAGGWFGNVTQVASGTNSITSSVGASHAIAKSGSGSVYSQFDGYRNAWPGGMRATVDVYFDMAMALNEGFDYSVAANGSDGAHQRDFIMHVTRSANGILVGASNNTNFAPRQDLGSLANHYLVTASGWFTIEHVFRDAGDGSLAVDISLLDSIGNTLFTETRNNASDSLATEVGGNRYAWFTHITVNGGIAIDEHMLQVTPIIPLPTGAGLAFAGLLAVGARRRRAL